MPSEQEVDAVFAALFGDRRPDLKGIGDDVLRRMLREALEAGERVRAPKAFACVSGEALRALHRERAKQSLAAHICSTDLTDGFCGPHDGVCQRRLAHPNARDCALKAEGLLQAIESRGCAVVWEHDPTLAITMEWKP